jgi:hypothetical protein
MEGHAFSNQLIAFTGHFQESSAIDDRDFPLPTFDHPGLLHLPCHVRDGRSLNAQHLSDQALA